MCQKKLKNEMLSVIKKSKRQKYFSQARLITLKIFILMNSYNDRVLYFN